MRVLVPALILLTGVLPMPSQAETPKPIVIAVHGGAGTISREQLTPELERQIRSALEAAVRAGHAALEAGAGSLDAVSIAVTRLEDSPLFNAGRGAVFNAQGRHELDASIMEGATRQAGAVAGVRNIRNPVLLARRVMTHSPHVMLIGAGAEEFARSQGIEFADDEWFYTEFRWRQLEEARAASPEAHLVSESPGRWLSTVGAVALDAAGNLAAATSTGGTTNKRWGRVGDSPIIGAGTYADNRSCAVSATGHGEFFIRATVARDICARMAYRGISLEDAADEVVMQDLVAMGGEGGVIAVDAGGHMVFSFNSAGMYRAGVDAAGRLFVGIYRDEQPPPE